ncbi:MAG: iron-containing alcohol dehydrogenase [Peptococcaceae bacterium]|nr:iron-containing alcohol dehydrogenase [Peptococcaceae bacterium]
MIPSYYEFLNAVKILSGRLALDHIPHELKSLGAKRPIILTNDILVEIGLVKVVLDTLKGSDIVVGALYDNIPVDSSFKIVNEIAGVYRDKECDSIIAIGGGSVIDTAKGVSVVITENTDDLMKYAGAEILNKRRAMPFIVVPTTAGTGSEVTLVAVIADPDRNVKMEFLSYNIMPDVAVIDPRMTKSLPPRATASTGMDALSHAVEAYTSMQKNPLSDAYAFAAINLIRQYLTRAVENGNDEEARLAMANAALMAGVAFSNSMVGIVHAIGHACGGVSNVAHGDAMTILLPYGMEYNLDKVANYYADLLLPLAGAEVFASTPEGQRAVKSVAVIREFTGRLNDMCGLPVRLRHVGVKEEDFERIARTAVNDGAIIMNPKDAGVNDVMDILRKAY